MPKRSDDRFVSVIVPVFNDAARLRLCLQALAAQTYGAYGEGAQAEGGQVEGHQVDRKADYEVIVVDNASAASENISDVVAEFPCAVYAYESLPGSYAARNRGVALAKGDILAFTDADCIPAKDWIEKGVSYLIKSPHCGLVAGQIKLFFRGAKANPIELYESVTAFPQQRLLEQQKGAATANVFTFSSVMDEVGPFNAELRSQGDLEWGQRVFAAGYQQLYAADVCVSHPARYTLQQLHHRTLRLAGGSFGRLIRPEQSVLQRNWTFTKMLLADLIPPVNFAISAFRDDRLRGFGQKSVVPLVLVWVRCVSAVEKARLKFGGVPHRG
ncbi:glycosyl transferase, group 2 family protein [Synechococcus sp. PCC 7335]|nr:glycosyl transferase, group 2 family protein [Synechococcus sp. PCC 7335]